MLLDADLAQIRLFLSVRTQASNNRTLWSNVMMKLVHCWTLANRKRDLEIQAKIFIFQIFPTGIILIKHLFEWSRFRNALFKLFKSLPIRRQVFKTF